MKFSIRYADQIIGALIILALGILIFVIFMLGSSQRWFARDFEYRTYFPSAAGLSINMPVQYKGFTIGTVKSVNLVKYNNIDQVEVIFSIFNEYGDRVKTGSLIELTVSPIGALGGSQFIFHPGIGYDTIAAGEEIPEVNSPAAKKLIESGQAVPLARDDSIGNIIAMVNPLLETVMNTVEDIGKAFAGDEDLSLGRTIGGLETAVKELPESLEGAINDIMAKLDPILANLEKLTASIAEPDGTVMSILDSEGSVYKDLVKTLNSLGGTIQNLEETTDFIPSQLPKLAIILSDLSTSLKSAEKVLASLTNNPLLKGGIPEYTETRAGGMQPRDLKY